MTNMQGVFDFYRGRPYRPKKPERLFFAFFPDGETCNRVVQARDQFIREHHLGGRLLRKERLHVSLHRVGDYKRLRTRFIHAASQAAKAVSMGRLEVTLWSINSFEDPPWIKRSLRQRRLVLLGEGDDLFELHRTLGVAMKENGLRITDHFVPHMTLSYGGKPVATQPIEPIRFAVNEFALIHSERGLTRYNVLDCWRLGC